MIDVAGRHPATVHLAQFFNFEHLKNAQARDVAEGFTVLATGLLALLEDGPELTACMRKLVEAKDCAVRAVIYSVGE